eukprot:TRINITY_DN91510_c0_g1_i1.p2 TRINITY_DN91510_c0_g1~~TRINITY_DN91510_c0_g1_i1.p2  ORF type:complete len:212 (-),score=51.44 TRINITY_DN91510_c0_g1_i1:11-646(-)
MPSLMLSQRMGNAAEVHKTSAGPKDWQCPTVGCVNHTNLVFARHKNCPLCGSLRTPFPGEVDWTCPACGIHNPAGCMDCDKCGGPPPEPMLSPIAAGVSPGLAIGQPSKAGAFVRDGKSGGFNERNAPGDKANWNSDDEDFDEFGRKKRKQGAKRAATDDDLSKGLEFALGGLASQDAVAPPAAKKGRSKEMSAKQLAALERLKNRGGGKS